MNDDAISRPRGGRARAPLGQETARPSSPAGRRYASAPRARRYLPARQGISDTPRKPDQRAHFPETLLRGVREIHLRSAGDPIRFPTAHGAFTDEYFSAPPPVVLDANRLRDDILYSCVHGQRTVLVTGANAGLFRLFCAEHVVHEVFAHAPEWSEGAQVSTDSVLGRWMLEYLPIIRVLPRGVDLLKLLDPDEMARVQLLSGQDPDDVPSATLALVLGAIYLSNDRRALKAVYGDDLSDLDLERWLQVLKAGGDAGELTRMLHLALNLAQLAGVGAASGLRRLLSMLGPVPFIGIALGVVVGIARASPETRQRLKSFAVSAGRGLLETLAGRQYMAAAFERLSVRTPSWRRLAETNDPQAVLMRACMHTLARSPIPNRSAIELGKDLPYLRVPQGQHRVRAVLRSHPAFFETWRGRWQVGQVWPGVLRWLERVQMEPA